MNQTIASRFINFLPIAGMSILFCSLFMKWFSCGYPGDSFSLELSYIDWLKRGNVTFHYFYFLCLSFAICFLFFSYFSSRASINIYFVLFLFMLFPTVLLSMQGSLHLAMVGFRRTIDYPCSTEPGFWLYIFGLAVILSGGCFRARGNARE